MISIIRLIHKHRVFARYIYVDNSFVFHRWREVMKKLLSVLNLGLLPQYPHEVVTMKAQCASGMLELEDNFW